MEKPYLPFAAEPVFKSAGIIGVNRDNDFGLKHRYQLFKTIHIAMSAGMTEYIVIPQRFVKCLIVGGFRLIDIPIPHREICFPSLRRHLLYQLVESFVCPGNQYIPAFG